MSETYEFKLALGERVLVRGTGDKGTVIEQTRKKGDTEWYTVELDSGDVCLDYSANKVLPVSELESKDSLFKYDLGDTVTIPSAYSGEIVERYEDKWGVHYKVKVSIYHSSRPNEKFTTKVSERQLEKFNLNLESGD